MKVQEWVFKRLIVKYMYFTCKLLTKILKSHVGLV